MSRQAMICGRTRKRGFKTQQGAILRAGEIMAAGTRGSATRFRTYLCQFCGFWHLTSKP